MAFRHKYNKLYMHESLFSYICGLKITYFPVWKT